jgi:uncharacterized surface protein with fasciclin (FAS1) repeats
MLRGLKTTCGFSKFVALLQHSSVASKKFEAILGNLGTQVTVFAPQDSAFTSAVLPTNDTALDQLLAYHMAFGYIDPAPLQIYHIEDIVTYAAVDINLIRESTTTRVGNATLTGECLASSLGRIFTIDTVQDPVSKHLNGSAHYECLFPQFVCKPILHSKTGPFPSAAACEAECRSD